MFYVETLGIRAQKLPPNWFELKQKYVDAMSDEKAELDNQWRNSTNMTSLNNTIQSVIDGINYKSEHDDNIEILWSVTVAIFVLFGMIGAFLSGKFADAFGR